MMFSMPLLSNGDISAIHSAAISLKLDRLRDALLSPLPAAVAAKLPDTLTPAAQLLSDLYQLNDIGALLDGDCPVPLREWLGAAHALAEGRPEGSVFKAAADRLSRTGAGRADALATHRCGAATPEVRDAQAALYSPPADAPRASLPGAPSAEHEAKATPATADRAVPPPVAGGSQVFNFHITNSTIGALGGGTDVKVTGTVNMLPSSAAGPRTAAAQGTRAEPVTPAKAPAATAGDLASVYLSYGDADLPFAQKLYEALEEAGVPVFFRHEHAVPGAKVHRSARRSIREYEHVILFCSARSLPTPSVISELDEMLAREFGEGASERIIPILLDDFASDGWTPRPPDIRQTVLDRVPLDMKGAAGDGGKFQRALKRLLGALKR